MTEATTDLADAGITNKEELEEIVVLAGMHVVVAKDAEGRCLKNMWRTEKKMR
jgi:hypothetical protein